jgi:glycosyltransferase involved in cell wall biosynthesis
MAVAGQLDFLDKTRTHVLMITNHGMHQWQVIPGLPDTGGQNVYVNQFTEALVEQGYRVTIVNRGGYAHPVTGVLQQGVHFHPSGHARIVYIEDSKKEFVRKEDMDAQLPELAHDLRRRFTDENDSFDLIISHYWDAGRLGTLVNTGPQRLPHVWVPHSLGTLKKRNMDPATWAGLRIDERINRERELLKLIDSGVATSSAIRDAFVNDYGVAPKYFLPPCIDVSRIHVMPDSALEPTWHFLAQSSGRAVADLKRCQIITEISRTDKTKRKDVLIKAFAQVKRAVPEALLVVSIDDRTPALYEALHGLIAELGLQQDVIVLGSVWEQLPGLYNVTSVYCTPSVMEGFGMSAQEGAATAKPVVASDLVPFVMEYLLGENPEQVAVEDQHVLFGAGAVVVPADFVEGFAAALIRLLQNDAERERMGGRALEITIPYFTWHNRTQDLLDDLGVCPSRCEPGGAS